MVGGSGVKLVGVGTTVAAARDGRGVTEGMIAVEVGSDDTGWLSEIGKTAAGFVEIEGCGVDIFGYNALACEQATSPRTSREPIKTTHFDLLIILLITLLRKDQRRHAGHRPRN